MKKIKLNRANLDQKRFQLLKEKVATLSAPESGHLFGGSYNSNVCGNTGTCGGPTMTQPASAYPCYGNGGGGTIYLPQSNFAGCYNM